LIDVVTLNHEFLASLEEYSKGRVFTIATGEKRLVKKKKVAPKKKGLTDEISEPDDDFNPENPDDLNGEQKEDTFYDEEMEEESDEEREVKRQFEFVSEISILVDYDVVKNYVRLISTPENRKNADVMLVAAHFFKRLVQ